MKNSRKPDFSVCEQMACRVLLSQKKIQIPVVVEDLVYDKKILFDTVEHYCRITGIPMEEITGEGLIKDGCTVRVSSVNLVLYSGREQNRQRINWTLAHEVGHICLDHEEDGEREEIEAHHFAAELLMPTVLLEELWREKECITASMVSQIFGVSLSAAQKRLDLLERSNHRKRKPEERPEERILHERLRELYTPLFREKLGMAKAFSESSFTQAEEDWLYGFL